MHDSLEELDRLKVVFTRAEAKRKGTLLRRLGRLEIPGPRELVTYHETLCFLRAFPDNRDVLEGAESELHAFHHRVDRCRLIHGGELPASLIDTGIAGTPYHYPYGLPMICWFVRRFGDAVDIDWDAYEEREDDPLSAFLTLVVGWVETIGTDDETLSVREWFEAARGRRRIGFLRWLVERMIATGAPPAALETLYDAMELSVRWDLGTGSGSRTRARMPYERYAYQTGPLRGRTKDFRGEILGPFSGLKPVGRRRGRAWIDLARCALSLRAREFYPIVLASDREVYEADFDRGVRIVLFGVTSDRRLPLETEYGVLFVRNGVPVGYGVGALLLDRIEIAVNVFPTYRGGESSFLFECFARLFHHAFGTRIYFVDSYQQGHGNDEGLAAGSFWFYHKLGFRPIDPETRALAAEETTRLQREPGTRTPRRLLRRLVCSDAIFCLDSKEPADRTELSLKRIGLRVSRHIEERFLGDRDQAERVCSKEVARILQVRDLARWDQNERAAFRRLSPLVTILPGLRGWRSSEKRSLARILRWKGSQREARHAREAIGHVRLRQALEALSRP